MIDKSEIKGSRGKRRYMNNKKENKIPKGKRRMKRDKLDRDELEFLNNYSYGF